MDNEIVDKNVIEEINKCCREAGMFGLQNVVYILYNDHIKLQEAQANMDCAHALDVCERVINHACEIGDSEWSVYSGFREAREAIKAAQQGEKEKNDSNNF